MYEVGGFEWRNYLLMKGECLFQGLMHHGPQQLELPNTAFLL